MTTRLRRMIDGFTLVELLVALTIASVLTVIALPTLKDSLRQNALARSAALVKGAFINARSQAIRTGRPFGVVIERRRSDLGSGFASDLDYLTTNFASRLYYVQSPIEYRGDTTIAAAYPVIEPWSTAMPPVAPPPEYAVPLGVNARMAKVFIPQASAGLLYAAVDGNRAARTLIGDGTPFSLNGSDYIYRLDLDESITTLANQVTGLPASISQPPPAGMGPVPGVLLVFDYLEAPARFGTTPGRYSLSNATSEFPGALVPGQAYQFRFRTNLIRAPLAPVSLTGRTVVDLSVSGTTNEPLLFNSQTIVDPVPVRPSTSPTIPPLVADQPLGDVVVLFSPDGRMEGIFTNRSFETSTNITRFTVDRVEPASTVSFNVGFVDGVLDNIDDGARFPDGISNTDFAVNTDDPELAMPYNGGGAPTGPVPNPVPLEVDKVPNFANSDCAWVSVQPQSGAIRLDTVAGQPNSRMLPDFVSYYNLGNTPLARLIIESRVRYSRRLVSSGVTP